MTKTYPLDVTLCTTSDYEPCAEEVASLIEDAITAKCQNLPADDLAHGTGATVSVRREKPKKSEPWWKG